MMTIDLYEYQNPMNTLNWVIKTFGHPGIRWKLIDLRYITLVEADYTWFIINNHGVI